MTTQSRELRTGIRDDLLGDFKLIREIGRGGMGRVYEAEQLSLQRRVAIKILPPASVLSTLKQARFKCEAMVAAQLKHPNIVDVYAVGCDQGIDYYAMEYVEGRNLAEIISEVREARGSVQSGTGGEVSLNSETIEWIRPEERLAEETGATQDTIDKLEESELLSSVHNSSIHSGSIARELRGKRLRGWYSHFVADLILQITGALTHAHRMGVVHRDIKPSNLILDLQGRVLITDFGLCRVESEPDLTASGTVLGTLRYSSPEQASGKRSVLDERADVYSLGATLYELLTLRAPFETSDAARLLQQVLTEDPPAPRKIAPWIPNDLETIVLKAIAKETGERYQNADEFGDDLRRFLDDRPIQAKRPSLASRVSKWGRRNSAFMIGVTVVLLFGTVSLLISTLLIARAQIKTAEALVESRRQTDLANERSIELNTQVRTNRVLHYVADMKLAERALKDRDLLRLTEILDRFRVDDPMMDLRGPEWGYLWNRAHSTYTPLRSHVGGSYQVRYSNDGRLFASCGADSEVRIYRAGAVHPHSVLSTEQGEVNGIDFDDQCRRIATAGDDGTIRVWDLKTQKQILKIEAHADLAFGVLFVDEGKLLVTCGREPDIHVWDSLTGKKTGTLHGHSGSVEAIRVLPNGRHLASVSEDRTARIWNLNELSEMTIFKRHAEKLTSVDCSPDGQQIVTGDQGGTVMVWQAATGEELSRLTYADSVQAIACALDGSAIAVGDRGGVIHLLPRRPAADLEPQIWKAHDGKLYGLTFNSLSSEIVSAGQNGPVRNWRLSECEFQFSIMSQFTPNEIAFMSDGRHLAIATEKGVHLADLAQDGRLRTIEPAGNWVCVASSRDSGLVAAGNANGTLAAWDQLTGRRLGSWQVVKGKIDDIVVIDDSRIAWLSKEDDAGVRIVDAYSGELVRFVPAQQCESMCVSPNGKWLAVVMHGDFITLWNLSSASPPLSLRGHRSTVVDLAFASDSTTLYSVSNDRSLIAWNVSSGSVQDSRVAHESDIECVAVSGVGHTIATVAERESSIRLWNASSGQPLFDIGISVPIRQVAFDITGSYLAGLRKDGIVEVVHTSLGERHVMENEGVPRSESN